MPYFIDIILPIPLEKLFSYKITDAEAEFLSVGMRVAVPFGKSKIYTGLVHAIHQNAPIVYEAKEIHQILDERPVVTNIQLKFWEWISNYYMCSLGEVMRAALPTGFLLESETIIKRNLSEELDETSLEDEEFLIYDALHHNSSLSINDVMSILDKKRVLPVINRLIEKNAILLHEEIFQKYKPKLNRYIRLNRTYSSEENLTSLLDELNRAPKQRDVLMHLFNISSTSRKPVKIQELAKISNASTSTISTLLEKGILEDYYIQEDRVNYEGEESDNLMKLNSHQKIALDEIKKSFKINDVTLLHGVTSSGKTEIYVKLIEKVLESGKQALYLLPEIALTTQLVNRLQEYFGEAVIVYHSKYSSHERFEVWNNVLENSPKAQVIIGARSSILLPFQKLGLVIVDEEHETSFKQFDPAPRYHARDASIVLANLFKAKTLLGSATPSLESYHNAKSGKFGMVTLNTRFNNVLMPEIELVDIREKYKRKLMKGHFSDRLIEEMTTALTEGNQVILFQNRRGFSPIIECTTCGHSPQCPNCDVSLTYHQYRNQLRCHYCGYHTAMHTKCEACGVASLDTLGLGTEQVEEEVNALFPDYKSARMDLDTTRGKYGYEKIITSFEQQEIDILIGTQMVTKGLDFRNVRLVGIMNADSMLNFPDFRAHERSFQLMVQVSGRAGRTDARGKVLIQSYDPNHKILKQVSMVDYEGMYKEQMDERHNFRYPPIYRLIKLTFRHKDFEKVNNASEWFAKALRHALKKNVLGPEFPPVSRIRNQYNKNILVKVDKDQSISKTKKAIIKINNSFLGVKDFRSVRVIVNVDNY
ncbi:replication restart DNA helicase PriA [Flavobacteriaceae bacterium MAR_2010_188]|nr:replication restart DNA helicase PriA [Flavobacteriaceae bacterium MAR_2010_188]